MPQRKMSVGIRSAAAIFVGLGRWYRTGHFFANGRQLTWEYPRATPDGDQIDLVEVMDVSGGLITHHRVYWGWIGFRTLSNLPAGTK